jgi:hypothetical protein
VRTKVEDLIKMFTQSQLVIDQVTTFTNLELLPLKATVHTSLLGIADYSASAIHKLYAAGFAAAQAQIKVVEFRNDDGSQMPSEGDPTVARRDLQFTPIDLTP